MERSGPSAEDSKSAGRTEASGRCPPPTGLPQPSGVADLAGLVATQAARIEALELENAALREENRGQRAVIARLEARVRELEARINQNSHNSSRPPSSDLPSVPPRPPRGPSRRQPGGQPGHPGHRCAPVPREQVDRFVDCWPEQCAHCHATLPGEGARVEDGPPLAYQVQDVHVIRVVTQYDQHRVHCPHCRRSVLGPLPAEVARSQYGPGLTAMVAVCSGVFQLARREMQVFCQEVLGVSISVGSVQKLCEQVSAGLAAPVEELTAAIRAQSAVGMDETGWRDQNRRRYLWVMGSAIGSVFKIETRAAKVARNLLGPAFAGCVMTDRYPGYDWLAAIQRQLCWAHLDRDAKGLIDLGKAAATYGKGIHQAAVAIFKIWRDFQAAGGTPEARLAMQAALVSVQEQLRPVLQRGCRSRTRKVVNLCASLTSNWDSLWLFALHEGVEPTNNARERDVRRAVLWRRRSLGTHSEAGAAFVERMLAVSATCRRQRRSPLAYLTALTQALSTGGSAPTLVPAADQAPVDEALAPGITEAETIPADPLPVPSDPATPGISAPDPMAEDGPAVMVPATPALVTPQASPQPDSGSAPVSATPPTRPRPALTWSGFRSLLAARGSRSAPTRGTASPRPLLLPRRGLAPTRASP